MLSTGSAIHRPCPGRLPAKRGTRARPPDTPPRLGPWPLARVARDNLTGVYFTDRGIEELAARRGEEQVSLEWLAERLRTFVDLHPELETPIERLATWLARLDDDED